MTPLVWRRMNDPPNIERSEFSIQSSIFYSMLRVGWIIHYVLGKVDWLSSEVTHANPDLVEINLFNEATYGALKLTVLSFPLLS